MDLLKSQFDRIQQQLAGLSASQKMLAACLVVIIVMTIGWWGRYAAVPEMEAVTHEALSPEDLQAVRRQLRGSGIPSSVTSDGRVEVPADRFAEAVADLTFSEALPKSSKIDFQALVKDMNPFTSQSTTEAQFNDYTQTRLAEVIAKFPGVQWAEVFIDRTEKVRMGGGVRPSATVTMKMKRGEPVTQKLVDAAGHFVGGSVAALSWQRVKVIIDGQLRPLRDAESGGAGGGEAREIADKYEKDLEDKIRGHFSYIPGMKVSVSFKVAMDTKRTVAKSYDKENVIHKPIDETERISESTTPLPGAGAEPGAMPNTGMTIASATGAGGVPAVTSESETKTKSQLLAGEKTTEISTPAGSGTAQAAAVQVPRSYIADIIKAERGGEAAPDEAAIQERFRREMAGIRSAVTAVAGLEKEESVLVSMFTEVGPQVAGVGGGFNGGDSSGFSAASVAAAAGKHSREILLGGLAVMSLFMVSMMVRKGNPLPAAAIASLPMMPMPVLDASESLAGEVSEGKSMLDAMELDDDAVRAQQMVDQVSSMVEENPDAAAGLVKRWLNRS